MAVAYHGVAGPTRWSTGSGTLSWPASTTAGMFATLFVAGTSAGLRQPTDTSGWTLVKHTATTDTWAKRLTADDIAAALPVTGFGAVMLVTTGTSATGRQGAGVKGCTVAANGAVAAFGRHTATPMTPTGTKKGTDAKIDEYSKRYINAWLVLQGAVDGYLAVTGTSNVTYWDSVELLPLYGPDAPTLTAPAPGAAVDYAAAATFAWVHRSTSGQLQEQARVRLRVVGTSPWYYILASGVLSAADAEGTSALSQATQSVSLNASQLSAGSYEWTASTYDNGSWGAYATPAAFTATTKPTVSTITVTSPAEDLTPSVAHTASTFGGQASWQVRISPSAHANPDTPTYDSGVLTGSGTTHVVTGAERKWTNAATLYAWVRVRQADGLWSDWTKDDATFSVTWTAPTAPSTVTAATPASGPLQVTVSGIGAGYDRIEVETSLSPYSTWTPVLTAVPSGSSMVIDQPLARYGVSQKYRARLMNMVDGIELWSGYTVTASAVASTDLGAYLVADDGSSYLAVNVAEDSDRVIVQGVSVLYGLGATFAAVDKGPTQGEAGVTTLLCETQAEASALAAWLTSTTAPVWKMRWNPERTAGGTYADTPTTRLTLADGVSSSRLAQTVIQHRRVRMAWVQQ